MRELQKTPFQMSRQPQSIGSLNFLQETIGFHFNQPPTVHVRLESREQRTVLILEKFTSREYSINLTKEERQLKSFDTLSTVFIDRNYNGTTFELDDYFFKKDMDIVDNRIEINLKETVPGTEMLLIICDVYGNDTKINLRNR